MCKVSFPSQISTRELEISCKRPRAYDELRWNQVLQLVNLIVLDFFVDTFMCDKRKYIHIHIHIHIIF